MLSIKSVAIIKQVDGNINSFFSAPSASIWLGNLEIRNTKSSTRKPGQPTSPFSFPALHTLRQITAEICLDVHVFACALSPAGSTLPSNICQSGKYPQMLQFSAWELYLLWNHPDLFPPPSLIPILGQISFLDPSLIPHTYFLCDAYTVMCRCVFIVLSLSIDNESSEGKDLIWLVQCSTSHGAWHIYNISFIEIC